MTHMEKKVAVVAVVFYVASLIACILLLLPPEQHYSPWVLLLTGLFVLAAVVAYATFTVIAVRDVKRRNR